MSRKASAAVLKTHRSTLEIDPVRIEKPRAGEVLVEIKACGICHTDMVIRDGYLPTPTPVVLGHEGAGVILEVGDEVSGFKPGDSVLMSFSHCGSCPSCEHSEPAYCHNFFALNFFATRDDGSTALSAEDGTAIHSHIFGQSAFASHALVPVNNLVLAPSDASLEILAPLGCGIQTGVGAVLNSLEVQKGSTILVVGAGAVGMSAIMGAKIAEADQIIAIDVNAKRLELAMELGASHSAIADGSTLSDLLATVGCDGVDYVVDTTGVPPLLEQGLLCLNPRGTLALVAAYPPEVKISLEAAHIMSGGRRVIGVVEGGANPAEFIPELIEYHKQGKLPIEKLIKTFAFEQINEAIEAGESGEVIKPVVIM